MVLVASIKIGEVAMSSVVTWYEGDLVAKVYNVLGETGRKMSGHVVSIVRVGVRFAACHRDAGFSSRAGQI